MFALPPVTEPIAAPPTAPVQRIGRSAGGRPIVVRRVGRPDAPRTVLVVGEIHGSELAGRAVTRALRRVVPPSGTQLLLIDDLNPDGAARGARQNRRGVDLNRNFGIGWRGGGRPFETYYPGRRPFSEPESRALAALVKSRRPRVTITFHQQMRLVDRSGGDIALERLYARRSGLPLRTLGPLPGTATRWQNRRFAHDTAFVVELPAGRLSRVGVVRHRRAVLAVARAVARQPSSEGSTWSPAATWSRPPSL